MIVWKAKFINFKVKMARRELKRENANQKSRCKNLNDKLRSQNLQGKEITKKGKWQSKVKVQKFK